MKTLARNPFYVRLASILLILSILIGLLYVAKGVLIPVLIALLFAILIRPINVFLSVRLRFPDFLSSLVTVTLFVMIIIGILSFISFQVSSFSNDWEVIEANISIHLNNFQNFVEDSFGLDKINQKNFLFSTASESKSSITSMATSFLLSFSDTLFNLVMIPIYMFLFLLYQNHFITFLIKLTNPKDQSILRKILFEIKTTIQSYLSGVLIQISVIALLTGIGLALVGVKHALLLGIITGVLGIIPYIGNIISTIIIVLVALTGAPDLSLILWALAVMAIVQIIDGNITVPLVVSSKVSINAFSSIIGIFVGGMLAGIAGMFLAIPILAILKVIFDNIPSLEPWGYLMGDDLPKSILWKGRIESSETEKIITEEQENPESEQS